MYQGEGLPKHLATKRFLSIDRRNHQEHHFIPIKTFPNDLIRSHTITIRNATPHRYLSRSFAPGVSFGTDVWAAGVPGPLESTKLADESLGVEGVSVLVARCSVGVRDTSPRFVDDTFVYSMPKEHLFNDSVN
jgi:hypothetical protein